MAEQQWEYCELVLDTIKEIKKGGRQQGWGYDCHISFYGPGGKFSQLASSDNVSPFNPWKRAMAFLGSAGWELVSVQHGNVALSLGGIPSTQTIWDALSMSNRVAYLKRPVVSGRPIDEPKLVL